MLLMRRTQPWPPPPPEYFPSAAWAMAWACTWAAPAPIPPATVLSHQGAKSTATYWIVGMTVTFSRARKFHLHQGSLRWQRGRRADPPRRTGWQGWRGRARRRASRACRRSAGGRGRPCRGYRPGRGPRWAARGWCSRGTCRCCTSRSGYSAWSTLSSGCSSCCRCSGRPARAWPPAP